MAKQLFDVDTQLSRIEQASDRLLERRVIEYGYTFSAISANLIQNFAIATSVMFALFLILTLVFSFETNDALKVSGIVWSIVMAVYTIVNFSKDEVGLIKLVYIIGQLSNWKKILFLNRTVIDLQQQLESANAVSATSIKSELLGQAQNYFQGKGFAANSKAFPYLMKRKLAYLNSDGAVILNATDINDLMKKLKESRK